MSGNKILFLVIGLIVGGVFSIIFIPKFFENNNIELSVAETQPVAQTETTLPEVVETPIASSTPVAVITEPAKETIIKSLNIQGMQIDVLKKGAGVAAKVGDTVAVHYTGTFEDGTKFDSSVDRGTPFSFQLGAGMVIKGWDLGVAGMQVGEKRKLTIPYDLAYGADGYGPIPPKATLLFDVELIAIK